MLDILKSLDTNKVIGPDGVSPRMLRKAGPAISKSLTRLINMSLAHVYHIMCEALDKKKEVRVVFWDISKTFDRVWHEGLLYRLETIGIIESLLLWFQSYLSNRTQKVVIGNDSSCTGQIKAGVPQGSVQGPLLFLVFINDITENINSNIRLFADDTTLFIDFDDESEAVDLTNKDLDTISK